MAFLLAKGADALVSDHSERSVLHHAVSHGKAGVVQKLLQSTAVSSSRGGPREDQKLQDALTWTLGGTIK